MNNNVFINKYDDNIFFKFMDYILDNLNYYTINFVFTDEYILESYQKYLVYEYSSFSEEYNNKVISVNDDNYEVIYNKININDEYEVLDNIINSDDNNDDNNDDINNDDKNSSNLNDKYNIINYQFCLYLLNIISQYRLDLQKLEKINFLQENKNNLNKNNKSYFRYNTHYYKLYLFYALPNNVFLKLYKITDDFSNWKPKTFFIFLVFIDLYMLNQINKIKENKYENDEFINNYFNKLKYNKSILSKQDLIYFLIIYYNQLERYLDIIYDNMEPIDIRNNFIHNLFIIS